MNFERWSQQLVLIEDFLIQLGNGWASIGPQELADSMNYSLRSGGKRFRPLLSVLIAEAFGVPPQRVLPWGAAIELIHTYSLIHDDLPCMDNDDVRRGKPTNHKVFGESTALLSGDALLTEAFGVLAHFYAQEKSPLSALILNLSSAAGASGMVGGQVLDLASQKTGSTFEHQKKIHAMKTGALIESSVTGAALICGLPSNKIMSVKTFGAHLGVAFQIADDIEDSVSKNEKGGVVDLLGKSEAKALLHSTTSEAQSALQSLGLRDSELERILLWNQSRAELI